MATIINADTSDGLKLTSDTSGQIDFQSAGSTKATIDTSGNLKFDSGFGSVGTAYGVRAWVSFNGIGTPSINDSGNVSSIVDRALGKWSINLTNAMPDTNYTVTGTTPSNGQLCTIDAEYTKTTSQASVLTFAYNGASTDYNPVHVVIVR